MGFAERRGLLEPSRAGCSDVLSIMGDHAAERDSSVRIQKTTDCIKHGPAHVFKIDVTAIRTRMRQLLSK